MHGVEQYTKNADQAFSEQRILELQPLVKKIALHIKQRLPSHVALEDLMQAGFVGLLEANKNFKTGLGASFETYAGIRIRGAIFDGLRKNSSCTREVSVQMRKIAKAISAIEQRHQRPATTEDIIAELEISMEDYSKICQQISVNNTISLDLLDSDNTILGDDVENPQAIVQQDELKQQIKSILPELPEREQLLLSLYYVEELTFKQIGDIMDVTEARICQMHSQSIMRLKNKMRIEKF